MSVFLGGQNGGGGVEYIATPDGLHSVPCRVIDAQEPVYTATAPDILKGKTALTNEGVTVGANTLKKKKVTFLKDQSLGSSPAGTHFLELFDCGFTPKMVIATSRDDYDGYGWLYFLETGIQQPNGRNGMLISSMKVGFGATNCNPPIVVSGRKVGFNADGASVGNSDNFFRRDTAFIAIGWED